MAKKVIAKDIFEEKDKNVFRSYDGAGFKNRLSKSTEKYSVSFCVDAPWTGAVSISVDEYKKKQLSAENKKTIAGCVKIAEKKLEEFLEIIGNLREMTVGLLEKLNYFSAIDAVAIAGEKEKIKKLITTCDRNVVVKEVELKR